jgi:hypothetical protein
VQDQRLQSGRLTTPEGLGLRSRLQERPFQCRISVFDPLRPTAQALRAEAAATADSLPLRPPFGLGTCFHLVPFQCKITVLLRVLPTAQALRADTAATPYSESKPGRAVAACPSCWIWPAGTGRRAPVIALEPQDHGHQRRAGLRSERRRAAHHAGLVAEELHLDAPAGDIAVTDQAGKLACPQPLRQDAERVARPPLAVGIEGGVAIGAAVVAGSVALLGSGWTSALRRWPASS